jgi:glycosyltransferase involved in cell wall biosynthesis
LPVITTDCPGDGKKMVEHEKSGIIIPTDDAIALSQRLLQLLQDGNYREKLGKNARESVFRYDYRAISSEYLNFSHFILKNHTLK